MVLRSLCVAARLHTGSLVPAGTETKEAGSPSKGGSQHTVKEHMAPTFTEAPYTTVKMLK